MASTYKVGPKPPKTKSKEEERGPSPSRFGDIPDGPGKKSSDRDIAKMQVSDRLNKDRLPTKGDSVKSTVDDKQKSETKAVLRRKLKDQKDKIGASNPPHNFKKYD